MTDHPTHDPARVGTATRGAQLARAALRPEEAP